MIAAKKIPSRNSRDIKCRTSLTTEYHQQIPNKLGWPELNEIKRLQHSKKLPWKYENLHYALLGDKENQLVRLGCGGNSNDYCQMVVYAKDFEDSPAILQFAANCDVLWGQPRIWLEPSSGVGPRRFLTYHRYLVNGSLGESLEGGYWLWVWNGSQYRPQRP